MNLAALALLLLPDVIMPRPLELSAVSNDPVELERLASRLGPARLLRTAQAAEKNGQLRAAQAAVRGIGLSGAEHPDLAAQSLLSLLDFLQHTSDEKLQLAASESVLLLCQALASPAACAEPDDGGCGAELSELPTYLLQLVASPALKPPARVLLLGGLRLLPIELWRAQGPKLRTLAAQPALRDAALAALSRLAQHGDSRELFAIILSTPPVPPLPPAPAPPPVPAKPAAKPDGKSAGTPVAPAVAASPQGLLAGAAAVELCQPLLPRRTTAPKPATPAPALPALPTNVAEHLRKLAAEDQPPAVRALLADCLRVLATPADKALLQSITTATKKKR